MPGEPPAIAALPPGAPDAPQGVLAWLARRARLGPTGKLSPFIVRSYRGWAGTLLDLGFRPSLEGWEHLPEGRPYLLVANHSGGGPTEVCSLMALWVRRFGDARPVAGMAHPVFFSVPVVKRLLFEAGAIPSTYEDAERALAAGVPVLVFPGGDVDSFRPIWRARHADWNGRKGFLRIARRAWVPIVPLGIRGSHFTVPILWRSRVLPWLLVIPALIGLKRFPLTLPALLAAALALALAGPALGWAPAGAIAWLALSSPLAILPIVPWTIRARVGVPLEPDSLFGARDESGSLDAAYERVHAEIERLIREPSPSP